jgi:hypothetical protein
VLSGLRLNLLLVRLLHPHLASPKPASKSTHSNTGRGAISRVAYYRAA